jgi:subtilase-type serine protease
MSWAPRPTAQSLSPILSQQFTYQQNAVLMQIRAASYATVINSGNRVQTAYAQLLDQNRSNAALSGLYALDFASVDTIRNTFNALAPVNEQAVRSIAGQSVNVIQNFNDARLRKADRENAGGKIAITGRPLELAQMSISPVGQPLGGALMALQEGAAETEATEANLPDNLGMFLSAGFINGDIAALPGYSAPRKMDGYYISGGLEFYPGDETMLGLSGYYNSLDAETPLAQAVSSETYAASLYMRHKTDGGIVVDGQFTMGSLGFDTTRQVQLLGAAQTLTSSSDDLLVSGALGVSFDLKTGIGTLSPGIEARYASVDLTNVRENGGTLGLAIDRENFKSSQVRFGLDYEKRGELLGLVANAQLVWEFEDGPQLLGANFAQGTGPNANFVLATADQTWAEVGVAAVFGNGPLQFSAGFDTTIGRTNADAQVISGSATYRF